MRMLFMLPLILFLSLVVYLAAPLVAPQQGRAVGQTLIDQAVPHFLLPPPRGQGRGVGSADLTGRPQLVHVFASWCPPCRVETPLLVRLAREQGVLIRGIDEKDSADALAQMLRGLGNPYAGIGDDKTGDVGLEWGVYALPTTFVVDGGGIVRARVDGALSPEMVDGQLMPLLSLLAQRGNP